MKKVTFRESFSNLNYQIYLLVGEEDYYKNSFLNKIKDHLKLSIEKYDCSEIAEEKILDRIRIKDLFNTSRIFYLENSEKLKNVEFFNFIKDDIILMSFEKTPSKKLDSDKILYIDCSKPKPWDEELDIISKTKGFLQAKGYTIDAEACSYIYNQIGHNLYKLSTELIKLTSYKEPGLLSLEEVKTICSKNINFNIFDLVEFIINCNKKDALNLLDKIYLAESNPTILLINILYSHFEMLLYIKTTEKKDTLLAQSIKKPTFLINKKFIPQTKQLSINKIVNSLNELLDLDIKSRKNCFNSRYYLEKFILNFDRIL